ncbi:nickel pincer cofactor biosynthesis protein LarB [Acidobacteria bacterium AH-259-D05]|nr:nickel pincer cofactor biosynthesis protein LarB [Acidobacteria bacterium AH-259-D05]
MTLKLLKRTLKDFKQGKIDEEQIVSFLSDLPYEDLGFAKVDHHRTLRHGFPEVIFGKGKTTEQIVQIAEALSAKNPNILITSAGLQVFQELRSRYHSCQFYTNCHAVTIIRQPLQGGRGKIGIFSAGTADIPVAEEAMVTAQFMGNEVSSCYDVGVAGLHRILSQRDLLQSCVVAIVVAGMEGALPSVVGGLVDLPIIAVPTSVGYGASFQGLAALLGMLNSCAPNVAVVNIDNGFGAGYIASMINREANSNQATTNS